jgi:nitronate monooxygenase
VLLESGDIDAGLIWAGQVQGLIRDIPTCAELIERIIREAHEIMTRRLPQFVAHA